MVCDIMTSYGALSENELMEQIFQCIDWIISAF